MQVKEHPTNVCIHSVRPDIRIFNDSSRYPVRSSTGVIYEREELKQLVRANQNPICVITGKPLTETADEIDALI